MPTTTIAPLTQAITGDRSRADAPSFSHWQATPLRLVVSLPTGIDLTGADSVVAELHQRVTADPDDLLASSSVAVSGDVDGPFTIDFTAAQMNQEVGKTAASYWLVVAVSWPSDDRLEILAVRKVELRRHNASLTTPAPPEPALYITATQAAALYATITDLESLEARVETLEEGGGATLTQNGGYATLTIGGVTVNFPTVTPGA